jgi:threonine dehydrogenase-like Zn-dependent dehydrogenase
VRRAPAVLGVLIAAAAVLAGCSQVAAIAPVGGDRLAEVRFAGLDVLTSEDVDVRTAPVCAQAADLTVTCDGDTFDGQAIRVTSPGATPDDLEVVVGARTVYSGSLQAVLEKAMTNG